LDSTQVSDAYVNTGFTSVLYISNLVFLEINFYCACFFKSIKTSICRKDTFFLSWCWCNFCSWPLIQQYICQLNITIIIYTTTWVTIKISLSEVAYLSYGTVFGKIAWFLYAASEGEGEQQLQCKWNHSRKR
jgi:hypothetical protein